MSSCLSDLQYMFLLKPRQAAGFNVKTNFNDNRGVGGITDFESLSSCISSKQAVKVPMWGNICTLLHVS